jgi:acrylyl-CoA reductase (NADPH)
MPSLTYRAYQVPAPKQAAELVTLTEADLPEGDLTVRVTHSSLNYKDGLAMTGKPGVIRAFPLTCGIDLSGTVVDGGGGFAAGDEIVLTGANLSETRPGGYSGYQRIEAGSVVKAPEGLGTWGAMAVGTAGLTAMLCILRLRAAGVEPGCQQACRADHEKPPIGDQAQGEACGAGNAEGRNGCPFHMLGGNDS